MEDKKTELEAALQAELGAPVVQTAAQWLWPGTTSGREASRSFRYTPGNGLFYDFSATVGGGTARQFYERVLGVGWDEAKERLRSLGFAVGGGNDQEQTAQEKARWAKQRREAEAKRAAAKAKAEREREGKKAYAARLWNEAKPIEGANHPSRKWANKLNILHQWVPFPPALRWHGRGRVVAAVTPMAAWRAGWPDVGEVCAVALVAIDREGGKRMAFGEEGKKRDKTSYGPIGAGVVAFGSPTSKRVVLVEGIKDALAVYSHYRKPCAVLASINTVRGFINRPGLVDYLRGREVGIWTDTDEGKTDKKGITRRAGQGAGYDLQDELAKRGISSDLELSEAEGTDPGDWALAQEWPEIDRKGFVKLAERERETWPECEATRRAIHARTQRLVASPFHELNAAEIEQHIEQIGTFQGIDLSAPWPRRPRLGDPLTLEEVIMGGLKHETGRAT